MVLPGLISKIIHTRTRTSVYVCVKHVKLATSLLHISNTSSGPMVDSKALQNGNFFARGECVKVRYTFGTLHEVWFD